MLSLVSVEGKREFQLIENDLKDNAGVRPVVELHQFTVSNCVCIVLYPLHYDSKGLSMRKV